LILWLAFRPASKPVVQPSNYEPAQDVAARDRAAADLKSRIDKLPPAEGSGPSNLRYTNLRVSFGGTGTVTAPWRAKVEGREEVLDAQSGQPTWKTDFVLITDYEGGTWVFRSYHATTTKLDDGTTTEINDSDGIDAPAAIAAMMHLKRPRAHEEQSHRRPPGFTSDNL
jgi:hypothetical protein